MTRASLVGLFAPIAAAALGCAAVSGLSSFDELSSLPQTEAGADAQSEAGDMCAVPLVGTDVWQPTELPGRSSEYEAVGGVIADLDVDGFQDIVYANQLTQNLSVFYGRGNGTFETILDYPSKRFGSAQGPAFGDVDGDGLPDLVVASNGDLNCCPADVFVLRNLGGRKLGAPMGITQGDRPQDVALVDADGNGRPDLLVALDSKSCTALRINTATVKGEYAFADAVCLQKPRFQDAKRFDVEGDGRSELLAIVAPASTLEIGRFALDGLSINLTKIETTAFVNISRLQVVDLNHDAFGDFLVYGSREFASELVAYYGRGDGKFDECVIARLVPQFAAAGFLNMDDRIDLTSASLASEQLSHFYVMIQR